MEGAHSRALSKQISLSSVCGGMRRADRGDMDKIIFGDNQFFGINHMSEEKAQAQAERFRDTKAIIRVIDAAYECGIHAFMFNTHDKVAEICDHFRANPAKVRRSSALSLDAIRS